MLEFLEEEHKNLASRNISEQINKLSQILRVSKKVLHVQYGNIVKSQRKEITAYPH